MVVTEKTVSPSQLRPREWPAWHATLADYKKSSAWKASWQLVNTALPYFGLWVLMLGSIRRGYPYGLTLILAVVASAFLVRLFILFHDCVHGSLFPKKGANTFFGTVLGLLVFTSFADWRFSHLRHHASYANLDARGYGDIWTLTQTEYDQSSKWMRLAYRIYRHPAVLIGMGALIAFLLRYRLPAKKVTRVERSGVLFTNLFLILIVLIACRTIGWQTYLLIQFPLIWMAGTAGVFLFYIQHQFDGVYWARRQEWDALQAAMVGSSFYKLPAVLRWFSGSIGYHHVHHLGPRIPNYRLKPCYDAIPALQAKVPLTIRQSFSAIRLKIWDEQRHQLTAFH
jgi:omega-6 fatty acid desaturase (delta-12 desaturase)